MSYRLRGRRLTGAHDQNGGWWPDWWGKYVGLQLTSGATHDILTASDCRRIASLAIHSRRRAKMRGHRYEFVDLFEVGIRQDWKCFICGLPLEHISSQRSPKRLSVEHDPPVSKSKMHTRENVHLAHWDCNNRKGDSHGG